DEVPGADAVVLLSERLEITTNHRGGDSEIQHRDRKALGFQLSCRDGHITHAAGALDIKGGARDARSHAIRIARAHGRVKDCRSACGRADRRWAGPKS